MQPVPHQQSPFLQTEPLQKHPPRNEARNAAPQTPSQHHQAAADLLRRHSIRPTILARQRLEKRRRKPRASPLARLQDRERRLQVPDPLHPTQCSANEGLAAAIERLLGVTAQEDSRDGAQSRQRRRGELLLQAAQGVQQRGVAL